MTKASVDWEDLYSRHDTPWDRGAAHPALQDWLDQHNLGGTVLVPGCGRGHDVREIARRGATVTGLDIAPSAIAEAGKFPLCGNEQYYLGDFFRPSSPRTYDWIFEHTCFCAIDPSNRPEYVAAASQWLRPGGHLLAIFFLDPDTETGPPFGCTRGELDELFRQDFELLNDQNSFPTFLGRENRECLRLLRRR